MTVLRPNRYSGSQFTWKDNHGTAEVSDLVRDRNPFSAVYDDACDEGLTVVSHRTHKEVVFAVDKIDMNGDEVAGWRLVSISTRSGRPDGLFTLLVIND